MSMTPEKQKELIDKWLASVSFDKPAKWNDPALKDVDSDD